MKTDDIFEAMTDIDDKFIAAARPFDLDDESAVIHPAPKKSLWKTLVPVAACLAVLCTAGVFGARYIKDNLIAETPETSSENSSLAQNGRGETSTLTLEAPDLEEIRIYPTGARNEFVMEEFPNYTFAATYSGILLNGYEMNGVDMKLLSADYIDNLFLCDLNGDGKRELCATVQNHGVRSVEVLDFENSERYISDRKNSLSYLKAEGETLVMYEDLPNVDDRLLISDGTRVFDRLTHIFSNSDPTKAVWIGIANPEERFELEEFPDLYFEREYSQIINGFNKSEMMRSQVLGGSEFYLADLNGDGKREICTFDHIVGGIDHGYIEVYDIENDESYIWNKPDDETIAQLELEGGVLYIVTSNINNSGSQLRQPLTVSLLQKVEKPDYTKVPLDMEQTFTLPDFEGFEFRVSIAYEGAFFYPTFEFSWEGNSKGTGNDVNQVFLCDLDGDGRREIIAQTEYADLVCLRIYGIMDDGEVGSVIHYENGGYPLVEKDGKLLRVTSDDKFEPIEFSKSDLIPNFAQSYTELLDWDHTMGFTEIYPWSGKYVFSVENRRFQITSGRETVFDSGVELDELYRINDIENDRLYFAFKVKYNGAVGLLEITENSADIFYLNNGASLKPTNDVLFVVTEHGSKTFALPEQFHDIIKVYS